MAIKPVMAASPVVRHRIGQHGRPYTMGMRCFSEIGNADGDRCKHERIKIILSKLNEYFAYDLKGKSVWMSMGWSTDMA